MTREEIGRLFVEMGKETKRAARKWLKRRDESLWQDAVHDALVLVLEQTFADPQEARTFILAAVEQAAFLQFQRRRERDRLFPSPRHWVQEGQHLAHGPWRDSPEGEAMETDPVSNLPDNRPSPEGVLIDKEAEVAIAALARRLGNDPTWRGELYRLVYVEGKSLRKAALILGITEEAVKKRAERLREYLLGTREGKRVVKGRKG